MLRRLIGGNSCHVRCFGTASSSSAVPPLPWLFVGLGNPGQKFMGTRHNVGFEMVDAFADALGISVDTVHCKALFGQGFVGNVPLFLAKPQTYMNLSGESSGPLAAYYKLPLTRVMVFHDDMELPCGVLRIQHKGGHGSHNGYSSSLLHSEAAETSFFFLKKKKMPEVKILLRSVIDHFRGNREFARLRIGIGRPPGQMDPKAFLLQKFNSLARERIDAALKEGVDMLKLIPIEGLAECARWFNREQKYKHIQTTVINVEGEANHPGA